MGGAIAPRVDDGLRGDVRSGPAIQAMAVMQGAEGAGAPLPCSARSLLGCERPRCAGLTAAAQHAGDLARRIDDEAEHLLPGVGREREPLWRRLHSTGLRRAREERLTQVLGGLAGEDSVARANVLPEMRVAAAGGRQSPLLV